MSKMKELILLIKAISDQSRIRILFMLNSKSLCVCELSNILNLAQPTVSKHLKQLKDIDLIDENKDGKWVNYIINNKLDINSDKYKYLKLLLDSDVKDDDIIKNDLIQVNITTRFNLC